MRKITLPILLFAFAGAGAAFGADQATEQTIALKDSGQIVIQQSGTMIHTDASGKRVKMSDNKIMVAKDGSKVMMKNSALWQTIAVKGSLHPSH